jgi:hypothetical protein
VGSLEGAVEGIAEGRKGVNFKGLDPVREALG